MKHNKISKLALLAGLLVMNTTANSFYQCVPKKEWVEKIIKEEEDKKWRYGKSIEIMMIPDASMSANVTLGTGLYKFVVEPDSGDSYILSVPLANSKEVNIFTTSNSIYSFTGESGAHCINPPCLPKGEIYIDNNLFTRVSFSKNKTVTIKIYRKD